LKEITSNKYSKLSLYKKDNINRFRNTNSIKSEKTITDNIKQFKLKNNKVVRIYDYYEYKIDGKDFSQYLDTMIFHNKDSGNYNPDFSFSDINVGCIGPFGYFWDRTRINLLLQNEINEDQFLQEEFVIQHLKTIPSEHRDKTIESIVEESKNSYVALYYTYGDEYYPVNVIIEIDEDVRWSFNDREYKLNWVFKKEDYNHSLNTLLTFLGKNRKSTYG